MRDTGVEPLEPGMESPLDAAISQRDRGTLSMVQQALGRGDARLAFQPIVRADGQGIAFYEGLIRILDDAVVVAFRRHGDCVVSFSSTDVVDGTICASM